MKIKKIFLSLRIFACKNFLAWQEVLKQEKSQHTCDDGPTNCNIDFGKDIECHTRKKWNLEIDVGQFICRVLFRSMLTGV